LPLRNFKNSGFGQSGFIGRKQKLTLSLSSTLGLLPLLFLRFVPLGWCIGLGGNLLWGEIVRLGLFCGCMVFCGLEIARWGLLCGCLWFCNLKFAR
ncbi:MAG: hypothetical protein RSC41_02930, partial [Oscillospiraceae bacterium]